MKGRYHSPLRVSQAAATRERIVAACVAVMRRGADLTYASVAAEAGVQERTVYRHFPTKEDLEAALWDWIIGRLTHADFAAGEGAAGRGDAGVLRRVRRRRVPHPGDAPLAPGPGRAPQPAAGAARDVRGLRRQRGPGLPPQVRDRAAAVLQVLYSAASWDLLRSLRDMDADQAADAIELGIRSFLGGLRLQDGR